MECIYSLSWKDSVYCLKMNKSGEQRIKAAGCKTFSESKNLIGIMRNLILQITNSYIAPAKISHLGEINLKKN